MNLIDNITSDPSQTSKLVLSDGTVIVFSLRYVSNQGGWFYDISSANFSAYGRRVVMSPNMLREFRGVINFGIACTTISGYDPAYVDDFVNGNASLFLLDQSDISYIEDNICNAY